jgi:hypothetical protein
MGKLGENFLGVLDGNFTYHFDAEIGEEYPALIEEHLGSADIAKSFAKALAKLKITTDLNDIRLADDEDFNPGPYALAGISLNLGGDDCLCLLPSLIGQGDGNFTSMVGVVTTGSHGIPDHTGGFRYSDYQIPELSQEYHHFIGEFKPPKDLKGFDKEFTKAIFISFFGYLSHSFGSAIIDTGVSGFKDAKPELNKFLDTLWKRLVAGIIEAADQLEE